ncbi:MAG: hypothetical protein RIT13_820 [Pseudomonadota bacterium]
MFSHVMLGVNDLEVSKKFYDALLGTLGYGPGVANKTVIFIAAPPAPLLFQRPSMVSLPATAMAAPLALP